MVTRVILVRHGESTYNALRRVQGHCDESSLTEAGRTDAQRVGAALQDMKFDAAYSSPLKRAKETAELILNHLNERHPALDLRFRDDLKEINLLPWEGMPFQDVEEKYPEEYRYWRDRPHDLKFEITTAEGTVDFYPVRDLYEQAQGFWREVLPHHAGETILVVAHSGINRLLVNAAIGLGGDRYTALDQSNCGISVLNFAGVLGEPVQMESLNQTAHLGQPLPRIRRNQRGPRFLLVRHGETDWNRQKRFQGQIDVPLNDQGREQAAKAAAFLQDVTLDYAVSSPMLRPKETAELILQPHPQVQLDLNADLCEISHGLWEGKLEEEIDQDYPGLLQQWQTAPETVQMPEGENLQQVWDRAIAAWDAILQAAAQLETGDRIPTVLVVAHDAINKALLCHLVGLGPESFWTFKQGNGAVSVIDYLHGVDRSPVLQAMNITSHLGGVLDRTAAGAL